MKKANDSIDFSKFRARKNPFARRIAREGIELVHDGPSRASLSDIPELEEPQRTRVFARGRVGSSIQFAAATWRKLEKRAKTAKMPVDEWLRRLIELVA